MAADEDPGRALWEALTRTTTPEDYQPAPMAPMPEDPTICRWCGGHLTALFAGDPLDFCPQGCTSNDYAPYLGHCRACGRDFRTGQQQAQLCVECSQSDEGVEQGQRTDSWHHTYHQGARGRGGYRS